MTFTARQRLLRLWTALLCLVASFAYLTREPENLSGVLSLPALTQMAGMEMDGDMAGMDMSPDGLLVVKLPEPWGVLREPNSVLDDGHGKTVVVEFRVDHDGSTYANPVKATQAFGGIKQVGRLAGLHLVRSEGHAAAGAEESQFEVWIGYFRPAYTHPPLPFLPRPASGRSGFAD